jgi:SAM-dependent methyltransferase
MNSAPSIIRSCEPLVCCDTAWEQAYLRFETPVQERQKFLTRLRRLGAPRWKRDAQIVEIFCGRGNGLAVLEELGFTSLEGVDLSERLLLQYRGGATLHIADCRKLPFPDASRDIAIVQGGLHHLPSLPEDLALVLSEVRRVLRPGGRFVIVEPWMTGFLRAVHFMTRRKLLQRCWRKIEALGTMIDREQATYFAWLGMPEVILSTFAAHFESERVNISRGKIEYVGIRS